ncbi:MAG: glycosyltransferase [Bdellovibrionales bacterium]
MSPRNGTVHVLFHPVSAKRFAEPLVEALVKDGQEAELWVQPVKGTEAFLESLNVPARIVPSNMEINPVKSLAALGSLALNLHRRRPKAIYAHLMRGAFLPLLAAMICGVPVRIYHNHGVPYIAYNGLLRYALAFLEWANCHMATHIATDSPGMRPALRAVMPKNMPEAVVFGPGSPCGLAASEYAGAFDNTLKENARTHWKLKANDLVLAYIGRPHRRKGFHLTLEAFQRQFGGKEGVKLLVCGCTQADVTEILPDPSPNILVLGYLQDLMPVYQAADAIILPSFHEGFGNCLLEGAAQGCALLASRIPGPDAVVEDGRTGYLVETGNMNDLMRAFKQMDEDRAGLRAMGQAAFQKSREFSREKILAAYLSFMREAMASVR